MAINAIPTGVLPELVVDTLPKTGEENIVYCRLSEDEDLREMQITDDFIWYDGEYHPFSFSAQIYGAYFSKYQQEVTATITEMENTIAEQAALITELEEAVFPVVETSFDMMITSLMQVELELYDENEEVIPNQGLMTEVWDTPQELTYQNTVRKGTYYLKNADGYALGKPNGEIQPIIVDGTGGIVDLGSVEVIMIGIVGTGDGLEEGDEF